MALSGGTTDTSSWSKRLRAMTGRIDSFFRPLESVFLSTGSRLRALHGSVAKLSENVGTASALFSSDDMILMLGEMAEASRHIDIMRRQRGGAAVALQQMITTTDTITRIIVGATQTSRKCLDFNRQYTTHASRIRP